MNVLKIEIPIVMLSIHRSDQELSSTSLSMAKELSINNKVFFIDHPFSLKDVILGIRSLRIQKRLKALFLGSNFYSILDSNYPNLIVITPYVTFPINWLPHGKLYSFLSRINNIIYFKTIRKLLKDFKLKNYIYWNSYNPFYSYYLPSDIKPTIYIYNSLDNISESKYVKKHGPKLEQLSAKLADLRLASSRDLVKRLSIPGYEFTFLPNAANVETFRKALSNSFPRPLELKGARGKIIGYMGNICLRQDYDLIYKIAEYFKNDTLLLVGPRNDKGHHTYDFNKFTNIIFAGSKQLDELPSYLSFMDVAIIPFLVNDLTKSIYPLKLNEYLAAGKPVVSTIFSDDVAKFSKIVYLSQNHSEFIANIRLALEEKDEVKKKERIRIAEENTWHNRVIQFWALIREKQLLNIDYGNPEK